MKVWVTRTLRRAQNTAQALESLGFEALIDPVLEVEILAPLPLPEQADAIVFTSRTAVEIFAKAYEIRDVTAFCVGDATAEAVKSKGFARVHSASGDAKALFNLIKTHTPRPQNLILCAPEDPAAPLDQWLKSEGLTTTKLTLYRTGTCLPHKALQALDDIDIVLLHSPRAAHFMAATLRTQTGTKVRANLTFICISEATAKAFYEAFYEGFDTERENVPENMYKENVYKNAPKVLISQFPDEASMLMLLTDLNRPLD